MFIHLHTCVWKLEANVQELLLARVSGVGGTGDQTQVVSFALWAISQGHILCGLFPWIVVHTCNLLEDWSRRISVSLRLLWLIDQVSGQLATHSDTLLQKTFKDERNAFRIMRWPWDTGGQEQNIYGSLIKYPLKDSRCVNSLVPSWWIHPLGSDWSCV